MGAGNATDIICNAYRATLADAEVVSEPWLTGSGAHLVLRHNGSPVRVDFARARRWELGASRQDSSSCELPAVVRCRAYADDSSFPIVAGPVVGAAGDAWVVVEAGGTHVRVLFSRPVRIRSGGNLRRQNTRNEQPPETPKEVASE